MSESPCPNGSLPLEGLRVVDMGVSVAVPFACLWLARMGAEVIYLESRRYNVRSAWPPFADNVSGVNRAGTFNLLNAGKLSCTLDLSTPRGRELAREIIMVSDVVVENFSGGTMDKLGLGYDYLMKVRPDLIILSLSAFGRMGPMRDYVGYHSAVLLYSGLAAITGYRGGHPRILGSVFPDPVSGAYSVLALLQALYNRYNTGQGQHIDLAMYEAMMTLMPQPIMDYTLNGREPSRVGNEDAVKVPHGVYPCRHEDSWIAISVGTEEEWRGLCEIIDHREWLSDSRFANKDSRRAHADELDAGIAQWTRRHTPYEAMELLQKAGVLAGPTLDAGGILQDPHLRARDFVVETDHPEVGRRTIVGLPWLISKLPPANNDPAPLLGEHTERVLCDLLGVSHREVERLIEEQVVY
ncbi:MAG: CaiB/BaiF CoA transferase family protein [Dehalococcoidia bacterium]